MPDSSQLTADIDALPFLVVHGGWFWIVLVGAFLPVVMGVVAIARQVAAVLHARAIVAQQRAAAVDTLAEGRAVVLGRWHGDSIIVGEERVELDDSLRVVLGSQGDHVKDGAEVLVSGELAPVTSSRSESIGYRENGASWRIGDAEIYAVRPRVRPAPLSWSTRIVVILFALLLGYVTLYITGRKLVEWLAERELHRGDGRALDVGELDAFSVAASLPGSREAALLQLASALQVHPYRDEHSIRRQLGLARLRGRMCDELPSLSAWPHEQLAIARRCSRQAAVFDILVDLGEFEAAWQSRPPGLEWPYREGMVAIALGDWAAAAEQAGKLAARNREKANKARERSDARRYHEMAELGYQCLALWFQTLAGEAGAAESLRSLATQAPGMGPVICAPMVAQTLERGERVNYLEEVLAVPLPPEHSASRYVRRLVEMAEMSLWLAGGGKRGRRASHDSLDFIRRLADNRSTVDGWLAQFGVEPWRSADDAHQYVTALSGVVLREIHRGDFVAARRAAEAAQAVAQAQDERFLYSDVDLWFVLIALREGDRELPATERGEHLDALQIRRGQTPGDFAGRDGDPCHSLLRSALLAAQRGDGLPLARAMQACSDPRIRVDTLLGVLPLVQHGRAELANVLRWWESERRDGTYVPFKAVADAARRRDIARFVGDQEEAERWGQMAKRFLVPLEDPQRTLALILWQEL